MLLAIFTNMSITGTSTKTPTIVASATGLVVPKSAIATATASSKKLDAPIIPAGAATLCGSLRSFAAIYATKKMKKVWIVSGMAINKMWSGFSKITWPWKEKMITKVKS